MSKIDLGGETHELRYDFGAMRAIETESGMTIQQLLRRQGYNTTCLFVWGGLRHEAKPPTIKTVEQWLTDYFRSGGTFNSSTILINAALEEDKALGMEPKETAGGNG